MIAELFLIGQLLSKRSFMDTPPTVIGPAYEPPQGGQYPIEYGKPPDAPKPIFEVDPEAFSDIIKLKRFF